MLLVQFLIIESEPLRQLIGVNQQPNPKVKVGVDLAGHSRLLLIQKASLLLMGARIEMLIYLNKDFFNAQKIAVVMVAIWKKL